MDFFTTWLPLVAATLASGLAIWNFLQSPSKKNADDLAALSGALTASINSLSQSLSGLVAKLDERLDAVERRVQSVEGDLRHMPDREASHRLEIAIEKLNGRIDNLDERLKPVASISERMQELLLEQARR